MDTGKRLEKIDEGEMNPFQRSQLHYDRAKRLFREGFRTSIELERVLKEVTRAVCFRPKQINHYMLFGEIYKKALDLTSAIYAFRYVLYLKPNFLRAKKKLYSLLKVNGMELIGYAEVAEGHDLRMVLFRKANDRFDEAMRIEATLEIADPDIWIHKSICYLNLCDLSNALHAVEMSIKMRLGPEHSSPTGDMYILKAKILWSQGLMDAGDKEIMFAASLSPNHPEVVSFTQRTFSRNQRLYRTAVDYFGNGEYGESLKYIKAALLLMNNDIKLHIFLSKIYRMLGQLQDAYTAIQNAGMLYARAAHHSVENSDLPIDMTEQVLAFMFWFIYSYTCLKLSALSLLGVMSLT